jgi:LL-diaminopimelate aminotransferase
VSDRLPLAKRLASLPGYAFDEIDRLRDRRAAEGADVIDFGVGDPVDPTPDVVVSALRDGALRHRTTGYPSYVGSEAFRMAAAQWMKRRHGVTLDPATQITTTLGSKEAVFHLPLAFVDPGRVVLVPSPGYPPYVTGTWFAGGRAVPYAVQEQGAMLPDLDALSAQDAEDLAVVWITQPHVPTGRAATREALDRLRRQCVERGVLLCSDEAYSELWYGERRAGALETGTEGVLVFQSLSKQANMTGYRLGFVAGDVEASARFRRLKTQIDSGAPDFVQDGGRAALATEEVGASARERYRARIEVLLPALRAAGCEVEAPEAGLYLWARVPGGDGVAFARDLLAGPPALVVVPGEWLAQDVPGCDHPGRGRVRLALVPELTRCRQAAERLQAWSA